MAVYKVPQDVEAEDKLVGPFTFRQSVYMGIALASGGLTFLLVRAPVPFPFFSALTVPVMLGFLILALPLRKDQPMEIYLMAILRFMLKPKRRVWSTDGVPVSIIIDAPKVIEQRLTKNFTGDEAADRLTYLAKIVDSRGWAAKGVNIPNGASLNSTVLSEAESTVDVLDEDAKVARSFDTLIARQKESSRNAARQQMEGIARGMPYTPPSAMSRPINPAAYMPLPPTPRVLAAVPIPMGQRPQLSLSDEQGLGTPEPRQGVAIQQSVVLPPPSTQRHPVPSYQPPQTDSPIAGQFPMASAFTHDMTLTVAPAILNLANNKDLSIQAIAHEAERMARNDELEVEIPLR